ncbi:MAG: M16 family metallopeptidase, partial [Desulfobia sp.]
MEQVNEPETVNHETLYAMKLPYYYLTFLLILLFMPIKPSVAGEIAPDLYKEELDNGLTLIAKDVEGSRAATVQIWVKAGSIYEEQEQAGITHVIEHMIFKGTPDRGPGEIAGMVEGLGGKINAYTGYEYTVYHATMPNRHREKGLEVLSNA